MKWRRRWRRSSATLLPACQQSIYADALRKSSSGSISSEIESPARTTSSQRIKQPPTLRRASVIVRDQPILKPRHLVHPATDDLMLFDVCGEAVCPTCGARYRRTLNVIALAE